MIVIDEEKLAQEIGRNHGYRPKQPGISGISILQGVNKLHLHKIYN